MIFSLFHKCNYICKLQKVEIFAFVYTYVNQKLCSKPLHYTIYNSQNGVE